ncbi:MAG: hypothetical protein HYV04_07180 [Deltaproteobacteria bacterium]|nr:hypothetical protein [Deltaproteobacteria bacterium]
MKVQKKQIHVLFSFALFLTLLVRIGASTAQADELFEFERFRGVPNPPVTIREIPGGGAAWTIARGEARLDDGGTFKVEVEGLVLVNTGANPVPQFFATLSCQNLDGTTNNINTQPVPATVTGDAKIEEVLILPPACLGVMVFVRSATNNRWFAVSGF